MREPGADSETSATDLGRNSCTDLWTLSQGGTQTGVLALASLENSPKKAPTPNSLFQEDLEIKGDQLLGFLPKLGCFLLPC